MNQSFKVALFLSATILILIGFVFGVFFDDNEAILSHVIYGEFGRVGNDQYITDYHLFLIPFLAQLSETFPKIPVYGLWYVFIAFLFLFSFIFITIQEVVRLKTRWLDVFIITLLILTYSIQSIVFFHQIRISLLLSFVGIIISQSGISKNNNRQFYFGLLLFLLSLITRMHTPVIILGFYILVKIFTEKDVLKPIKQFSFHIVLSIIILSFYQIPGLFITNTGKYIEANYEYAILEKKSLLPEKDNLSVKDSIKYESLKEFFITDTSEFTIEYLQKTVDIAPDFKSILSVENLKASFIEITQKLIANKWLILLTIGLILLMILFEKPDGKALQNIFITTLIAFAIPYTMLLFLVDDMKLRFFTPFLAVWSFLVLREILKIGTAGIKSKIAMLLAIFSASLCIGFETYKQANFEKQLNHERKKSAEALYNYSLEYPLISFIYSDIPLNSNILNRNPKPYFKNIGYFDGGYLTYFSYISNRFHDLFEISPLDYKSIIELLENNENIRLYATENRLALIKAYFEIVYSYNFEYEPIDNQPDLGLNGKIYKVKKPLY